MSTYVKIGIALAIVAATAGALWWTYSSGESAGRSAERAAWQAREIKQQQAYAAEVERLRQEKDAQAERLLADLAAADQRYNKTKEDHAREKSKNDRFAADIRAGRLVLRDSGRAAAGEVRGGEGPAGAAAACRGDGKTAEPGELSTELSGFLWAEAARADEVIEDLEEQLHFAQDVIGAYYRLARDCSVGDPQTGR